MCMKFVIIEFQSAFKPNKCGAHEYYKDCLTDPNIIYQGGVITGYTMTENHCDDIHPWSGRQGQDVGTGANIPGGCMGGCNAVPPDPTTTTTTATTTTTLRDCDGGCQCDPWMWRHPDGHCVERDECPGQCGENEEYKCAVCTGR